MFRPLFVATAALLLAVPEAVGELPFGNDAEARKVRWLDEPADALAAARRTGRPILAYCTAENCTFCCKMEKETWSDPGVARLVSDDFVPLRLYADKHPEAVTALGVKAYPTTVLISPEGRAFAGRAGFLEPQKLTELVQPAVASTLRQPAF